MKVSILHKIKYASEVAITRPLAYPGEILVKVGDRVQTYDHLAAAKVSYLNSDLIFRGETVVNVGDYVKGGDALAVSGWWQKKPSLRAPFAGNIEAIDVKRRIIKLASTKRDYFLAAGFSGTVARIDAPQSVTLSTAAMQIKGVLGLRGGSGELVTAKNLNSDNSPGKIVWTDFLDLAFLSKAQALGVSGIVATGLDWEGYLALRQKPELGFLLLTGFGVVPLSLEVSRILQENIGSFVQIDGLNRLLTIPKEELATLSTPPKQLMKRLLVGDPVVIYDSPHFAREGKVVELYDALHLFESGLLAAAVRVRLNDGAEVVVPAETVGVLV